MTAVTEDLQSQTESGPELGALNDSQFFAVERDGARFVTRGSPQVFIGHRLASPGDRRPDGAWVEWRWDGHRLFVRNDRYGLVPTYYVLRNGGFAISTSIERLIGDGAPTELDEDALAVFLRLGTFVGDDTPFRAIRALPPATDYVWSGTQDAPRGEMPLGNVAHDLGHDEACRRYGELFRRAIALRLELAGDAAVALSGGMDSRHILLELCRAGSKPRVAVTARVFPSAPSHDVDLAADVCRSAGVAHVVLDQDERWLEREQLKNRLTGLCTLEHGWGLPVGDYLRDMARVIFDGLAGDVFTDCRGITTRERHEAFRDGRFTELAEDFLGPPSERFAFLAADLRRRLSRERAIRHFTRECARFAAAPNPTAAFWFWNRTRRTVALLPYGVWHRRAQVVAPFLDHDLFDFMISLPAALVGNYTLHAATIRTEFPDYAHIPFFSQPNLPPADAWRGLRREARATLWWFLAHGSSRSLSRAFVLSRLARAQVDRRYCQSIGWLPPQVLYLAQLGQMTHGHPSPGRTLAHWLGPEALCAGLNLPALGSSLML